MIENGAFRNPSNNLYDTIYFNNSLSHNSPQINKLYTLFNRELETLDSRKSKIVSSTLTSTPRKSPRRSSPYVYSWLVATELGSLLKATETGQKRNPQLIKGIRQPFRGLHLTRTRAASLFIVADPPNCSSSDSCQLDELGLSRSSRPRFPREWIPFRGFLDSRSIYLSSLSGIASLLTPIVYNFRMNSVLVIWINNIRYYLSRVKKFILYKIVHLFRLILLFYIYIYEEFIDYRFVIINYYILNCDQISLFPWYLFFILFLS